MSADFEKKVADFIRHAGLFDGAERVLLAVSGGADSMALLHLLLTLRTEGVLNAELLCAHINHQLRGAEADRDEEFVRSETERLGLSLVRRKVDVQGFARAQGLSIETAGRHLRIEALKEIAKARGCEWVATAHQKNDNAETIIHRLLRGTGFRGLGGIWPVRSLGDGVLFARPLLCVRRDEVVAYLQQRGLRWCEDRTNYDVSYRRNLIRHRLIPELQKRSQTCIVEELSRLAESARKFYTVVCDFSDGIWPKLATCRGDEVVLDVEGFSRCPAAVKVELVRRSLCELGVGEKGLTRRHYERVLGLADDRSRDRKLELPGGCAVRCEYDKVLFGRTTRPLRSVKETAEVAELSIPGRSTFDNYVVEAAMLDRESGSGILQFVQNHKNNSHQNGRGGEVENSKQGRAGEGTGRLNWVECLDFDMIKPPVTVRYRRPGDRFRPLGLRAEKKVGKFLTAAHVPRDIRGRVLVVADAEKIVWLCPVRISEQVKVRNGTRNILRLEVVDLGVGRQMRE